MTSTAAGQTAISREASNCRADSWRQLYPLLSSLHVAADDGPDVLVAALQNPPARHAINCVQLLRAMAFGCWHVQRLNGPQQGHDWQGLVVVTTTQNWDLRFQPGGGLRLARLSCTAS